MREKSQKKNCLVCEPCANRFVRRPFSMRLETSLPILPHPSLFSFLPPSSLALSGGGFYMSMTYLHNLGLELSLSLFHLSISSLKYEDFFFFWRIPSSVETKGPPTGPLLLSLMKFEDVVNSFSNLVFI